MADILLSFDIPASLPESLPVMPLRRGFLLPAGVSPFIVGRERSLSALNAAHDGFLIVAVQREPASSPAPSDLLHTAVLARVVERLRTPQGSAERVILQGVARVELTGFVGSDPHFQAHYRVIPEAWPQTPEALGMADVLRDEVAKTEEALGEARVQVFLSLPPERLVDAVAGVLPTADEIARDLLFTVDPVKRSEKVIVELVKAREAIAAKESIKTRIEDATRDQQKEYLLRQQLDAIKKELGQGGEDDDDLSRLRDKLEGVDLPDEVQEVVDREIRRLDRIGSTSPERQVAIDWLEWIAELPWNVSSGVDIDLGALEEALDASHYGLGDVKKQVLEHLAVRKLAGSGRAEVLLLLGPPGVGKTSIGTAIAEATGRKLVRVALGGMRDEAELRGHRRTYIGARPGRLVEGIRRAGTADPVVLLDEVDKLGRGWQGDPGAALLEILDPEQNHAFIDRYLEVPFDLSKVLFVATANDLSTVPGPLRDRLQVIEIAGYTPEEKVVIAKEHLWPTIAKNTGLTPADVTITDAALENAIEGWTREAGVRELQRVLGKIFRAAAVEKAKGALTAPLAVDVDDLPKYLGKRRIQPEEEEALSRPGIARGLAWTPVGGDVLYVEASTLPGNGKLVLTGQLGEVMKESARAALTYVLAHGGELGIPLRVMEDHDVHIHVPAGATPKDGPSAGVTMFTALASLLSDRAVRNDTAMTGEATLRGRVLPVGGIKSKVLAAHRLGMKRIILPRRNAVDLEDVPQEVRDELEFVLVDEMSEVLGAALEQAPRKTEAA
ncbi:MAG: endopeptidase La [Alphaproteobacteria bacterium]|nr:endopeptidase La [Alphaproteobacteria bacterium]